MIATRETVIGLLQAAMPVPVAPADDDDVKTLLGAVH
jgi:hypothetical protein